MSDKQKVKIVGRIEVPVSKHRTVSKAVYFFASEWNLLLSAAQIAHQNSFLKKTLHSLSNSKTGVHLVDIVSAPQEMYLTERWFALTFSDAKEKEKYTLDVSDQGRMRLNEVSKKAGVPSASIRAAIDFLDQEDLVYLRKSNGFKEAFINPQKKNIHNLQIVSDEDREKCKDLAEEWGMTSVHKAVLESNSWAYPVFAQIKKMYPDNQFYVSTISMCRIPLESVQLDFKIRGRDFSLDEAKRVILISNHSCRISGCFYNSREFSEQSKALCSNIHAVTQMQRLGSVWGWLKEIREVAFDNLWAAKPLSSIQAAFSKENIRVPMLYASQPHSNETRKSLRGSLAVGDEAVLTAFSIREGGQHNISLTGAGLEERRLADKLHKVLRSVAEASCRDYEKRTFCSEPMQNRKGLIQSCVL